MMMGEVMEEMMTSMRTMGLVSMTEDGQTSEEAFNNNIDLITELLAGLKFQVRFHVQGCSTPLSGRVRVFYGWQGHVWTRRKG